MNNFKKNIFKRRTSDNIAPPIGCISYYIESNVGDTEPSTLNYVPCGSYTQTSVNVYPGGGGVTVCTNADYSISFEGNAVPVDSGACN